MQIQMIMSKHNSHNEDISSDGNVVMSKDARAMSSNNSSQINLQPQSDDYKTPKGMMGYHKRK